jgi:hypothetical protein
VREELRLKSRSSDAESFHESPCWGSAGMSLSQICAKVLIFIVFHDGEWKHGACDDFRA